MDVDPVDIQRRYSKLPSEELTRLRDSGELTLEALQLLESELARRPDHEFVAPNRKGGLLRSPAPPPIAFAPVMPMEEVRNYYGPTAFFRRHFNGDYSLGRSYLVNASLSLVFAALLNRIIIAWLTENAPARYVSVVVLLMIPLGILVWTWAMWGTWASSDKHVRRGGSKWRANAAKVMIILNLMMLRLFFESFTMNGPLGEHWKLATGWKHGPDATFHVRADGKSILLKGGINDGTAALLSAALDRAPSVTTVVLQSSGGWVREGNAIARVISERRLNTYVERECTSACTIALLAGHERSGEPNSRVGFHSFRSIGTLESSPAPGDIALARETYRRAHVSPSFIERIVATPPEKVWYPSQDELFASGVYTRLSLGGETAVLASSIQTREELSAKFKDIPAFAALAEKYPKEFDEILEKAWVQVQAKHPDAEVFAASRLQAGQLTLKLLQMVPDATLLDFHQFLEAQAKALDKRSPEACAEVAFPSGKPINIGALIPVELATRELSLMNEMIRISNPRHKQSISKQEADRVVQRVLSKLTPDQIQMLGSSEFRSAEPRKACNAIIAYLTALNSIPESERGRALRAFYSNN